MDLNFFVMLSKAKHLAVLKRILHFVQNDRYKKIPKLFSGFFINIMIS